MINNIHTKYSFFAREVLIGFIVYFSDFTHPFFIKSVCLLIFSYLLIGLFTHYVWSLRFSVFSQIYANACIYFPDE